MAETLVPNRKQQGNYYEHVHKYNEPESFWLIFWLVSESVSLESVPLTATLAPSILRDIDSLTRNSYRKDRMLYMNLCFLLHHWNYLLCDCLSEPLSPDGWDHCQFLLSKYVMHVINM